MSVGGKKRAVLIRVKITGCEQVEESILRYTLEVDPDKVNILQATFEAFDGLATVRTFDAEKGGVQIFTNVTSRELVDQVIQQISATN